MKTTLRAAAIVMLAAIAHGRALAQEQAPVRLSAGPLTISFVPPAGVRELPRRAPEGLARTGEPVAFLFGDATREVVLVILVSESEGGPRAGAEFLAGLKDSQERQFPNLEWLGRGPSALNGRSWQRLTHRAGPGADDVVKDMYVTEWGGRHVLFSFTVDAAAYEARRAELEKSAATIELSRPSGPASRPARRRGRQS